MKPLCYALCVLSIWLFALPERLEAQALRGDRSADGAAALPARIESVPAPGGALEAGPLLPKGLSAERAVPDAEDHISSLRTLLANGWSVTVLQHQAWNQLSAQWESYQKDSTTYDGNGNLVSFLSQTWNESTWVNSYRFEYVYDASGNQTQSLTQTWSAGAWVNYALYFHTYDAAGNQTGFLRRKWFEGAWQDMLRYLYGYDANGNMVSSLYELWGNDFWIGAERDAYTYDLQDRRVNAAKQVWRDTVWVNSSRDSTAYNAGGSPTSVLTERWQSGVDLWIPSLLVDYSYDANGHLTRSLQRFWGDAGWVNSAVDLVTNDFSGNRLRFVHQTWNGVNWANSFQYRATYAQGRMLTYLYQVWAGGGWLNNVYYEYEYDASGNRISDLTQRWDGGQWTNKGYVLSSYDAYGNLMSETRQQWSGFDWWNSVRYVYTWQQLTGVEETPYLPGRHALSANYPNPFNPSTEIRYSLASAGAVSLRIYDLLGREVETLIEGMMQAGEHSAAWDARQVPSGVYFYRLSADGFVETKKMLLLR